MSSFKEIVTKAVIGKAKKTTFLIGRTFIKEPINANRVIAMPFSKTIWNNEGNNAEDILKIIAKKIHIGKNSLISQNIKLIGKEKIYRHKNSNIKKRCIKWQI
jgi:hypothetical protein